MRSSARRIGQRGATRTAGDVANAQLAEPARHQPDSRQRPQVVELGQSQAQLRLVVALGAHDRRVVGTAEVGPQLRPPSSGHRRAPRRTAPRPGRRATRVRRGRARLSTHRAPTAAGARRRGRRLRRSRRRSRQARCAATPPRHGRTPPVRGAAARRSRCAWASDFVQELPTPLIVAGTTASRPPATPATICCGIDEPGSPITSSDRCCGGAPAAPVQLRAEHSMRVCTGRS